MWLESIDGAGTLAITLAGYEPPTKSASGVRRTGWRLICTSKLVMGKGPAV